MMAHFQHGGHEPEVVISYHLRHLAVPWKEIFYSLRACSMRWYVCQLCAHKTYH